MKIDFEGVRLYVRPGSTDLRKEISDFWQKYYDDLGVPVPLDILGTNPSQLSKCKKIKLIGKL